MDDCQKLTDYLETILNLHCENQESLKDLEQGSKQLLQKVQEINARVAGLQMEVMEVQDTLHPPAPVEEEPETPPAPVFGHLLRRIGTAALLSPLLWNGIAAGVRIMQGWTGDLGTPGTLVMTTLISVAWGLLLIAVEPTLNRALERWEERRRANETEEDRAIEEFLNEHCSRKTDPKTNRTDEI